MKNKVLFLAIAVLGASSLKAQLNVGSTSAADASAILQATSTTKGFLPPVMTTTQRNAIVTPAAGLLIFNSTTNQQEVNSGTTVTPIWGANTAATFYNADGSLATTRTVALNSKQLNFTGTAGTLTIDSTGKNLSASGGALALAATGGPFGTNSLQLATIGGIVGMIVSTNNLTTGSPASAALAEISIQTQSIGTIATKNKQTSLRVESRPASIVGHYSYSTDSSEFQINNKGGNILLIGEKYIIANKNIGIGTGSDSIRSPLSITNNSVGAKITLFDGAGSVQYKDTAHYGFGISGGVLNYDVPWGASHVFNSNGKNGSGVGELYINNQGVTIPRRLNMNNGNNLFIGSQSGLVTANGGNTFLGIQTGMVNTSGNFNGFTGYQAGISNTTGGYNTFNGAESGYNNTTGVANTFTGSLSGISNTTGSNNVFSGGNSGNSNTTGADNVFEGVNSGYTNTTGYANVILGRQAGFANTTGFYNVISGLQSGVNNTTGHENVFSGVNNGFNNTTGSQNTSIGAYSGPATGALTNTTSIGANTQATVSNTVILGNGANVGIGTTTPATKLQVVSADNTNTTNIVDVEANNQTSGVGIWYNGIRSTSAGTDNNFFVDTKGAGNLYINTFGGTGSVGIGTTSVGYRLTVIGTIGSSGSMNAPAFTVTSDRRLKKNFVPVTSALGKVMQLIPYSYDKKTSLASTKYDQKEMGFLAQDVRKVFPELVTEGKDADKLLAVNYTALIPLLTKAIQEQQSQNDTQVAQIAALTKANNTMAAQLADLKDLKIAMASMQTELNKIALVNKIAATNTASK